MMAKDAWKSFVWKTYFLLHPRLAKAPNSLVSNFFFLLFLCQVNKGICEQIMLCRKETLLLRGTFDVNCFVKQPLPYLRSLGCQM